jgi:hypothetical protein
MGLDIFALRVKKGVITEDVDFHVPENSEEGELHYWRKHPNLHGWMESLYREKGGKGEKFNCNNVRITEADLDQLEAAINEEELPETEGFFFGESESEDKVGDLEFVKKAREAIAEGFDVYYTSWW